MSSFHLSVIIPVYNEEKRLKDSLTRTMEYLKSQPYKSEIIVVDDGSEDASVRMTRECLGSFPHKVLENDVNRGKGYAVRQGMLAGEGEYLLFTDADLSTPIEEVKLFLEHLQNGYDCVIGSRGLETSNVEVPQGMIRESMGRVFNFFAVIFSFRGIRDSQCGFKCFKRNVAMEIFARQKLHGFSFDAEILYLAQKMKYKILEAPVTWRNSANSRVRMFSDPPKMFWDLFRIRWLHRNNPL